MTSGEGCGRVIGNEGMLPGERCSECKQAMVNITPTSWMCQPCRRNVYVFPDQIALVN